MWLYDVFFKKVLGKSTTTSVYKNLHKFCDVQKILNFKQLFNYIFSIRLNKLVSIKTLPHEYGLL